MQRGQGQGGQGDSGRFLDKRSGGSIMEDRWTQVRPGGRPSRGRSAGILGLGPREPVMRPQRRGCVPTGGKMPQ